MIIKGEPAPNQDVQDIQQPPPEYTEIVLRSGQEEPPLQRPAPAAQPQYPPQPSPHNLTPQQREARIGREYRDRREYISLFLRVSPEPFFQYLLNAQTVTTTQPRRSAYAVLFAQFYCFQ